MPTPEIAPPALAITLFGPMQVRVNGLPMPAMRSRKVLWLLALLTLRHDRPVQREWIAGTLWPDMDQSHAFANLRPVISDLRRALGDQGTRLQSPDRLTLLLTLTDADVDLLAFDAAIKSGKLDDLERAVALHSGPLVEDCHEEWIPQERSVREQNCLTALLKLGEAALTARDHETAIGHFQRAASLDPWSDTARRGWMEALARSGDSNAALQVYRKYLEVLRSDPSAVPDEKTSALYLRLRTEARRRATAPSVVVGEAASLPVVTGYLPHPLTDLVGREDERVEVAARLRRSRLVTLTGLGGIGKTRLAIAVVSEIVGEYADGVWLVALDALSDSSLIAPQIASVLGLQENPRRPLLQSLTEHLRKKRLLLVLDNCEHLLHATAQAAEHLLRECAGVRILATSREPLGITGETVWSVPPLTAPNPAHLPQARATLLRVLMGYESVQLFVERAQSVQKSFLLSDGNARRVGEVCYRLDGIPLALELAAARVKAMTVEQIASRLEDYLGLLTAGSRTPQSRQQTLRATLDWSYALLSEAECSLLRRLSVFAGGFHLDAAEQVCALSPSLSPSDILDLLTSLVDKSLVLFEERGATEARYRLLEMVKQYAGESLQASGEAELVKTRHQDWFLALAESAEPRLAGSEQAIWLERLETEHDNLRAALAWREPQAQGAEANLRLAIALWQFWQTRGYYSEGRVWLSEALGRDRAAGRGKSRVRALNGAGVFASHQGDFGAAREMHEQSLAISRELGDKEGIASSLHGLGIVAYSQGDHGAARKLHEESLAIRRELGEQGGIAGALNNLGGAAYSQGDIDEARMLYEESLAIRRELGNRRGIASALNNLGNVANSQGDNDAARLLYEESLVIGRELGDKLGIAFALLNLGNVAYYQGDNDTARTLYEESLVLKRDLGDKLGIAYSLNNLGAVAHSQGDNKAAQTLYEESLAISRELGDKWAEAQTVHSLGEVAHSQDDYSTARTLYQESLLLKRDLGGGDIDSTLEGMAKLGVAVGEPLHAARLWGAAERLREETGSPLKQRSRSTYEQHLADARAAVGNAAAFDAAWTEGRAMTLEQAVSYALEVDLSSQ